MMKSSVYLWLWLKECQMRRNVRSINRYTYLIRSLLACSQTCEEDKISWYYDDSTGRKPILYLHFMKSIAVIYFSIWNYFLGMLRCASNKRDHYKTLFRQATLTWRRIAGPSLVYWLPWRLAKANAEHTWVR